MKAIILAAGTCGRMRPLTDTTPKTLLHVGGRTILGRIIDGLVQAGISEVLVVTGYLANEVEKYLLEHHSEVRFQFVRNERYLQTNNICSLALAFENLALDDDILLIESDLICEPAVFTRIVKSPHANVALVDHYRMGMDGTVVTVEDGVVTNVIPPHLQSGDFSFAKKYKTLNIYKFSKEFCKAPFKRLLTDYASIDANCYYELVLGILIYTKRAKVHAEIIGKEKWAEIDDPNDLQSAEFKFNPATQRQLLEASSGGFWSVDITDFCFIRNMYFPTPSMLAEMRNHLAVLVHNYGSNQRVLNRKLSYFLRCTPERVQVLNGLSQIYPFLSERFARKKVLLPDPTFGEYKRCFPVHTTYRDEFWVAYTDIEQRCIECDVVVFVNPNNPTGTTIPTAWIFRFAQEHSEKLCVVDESFIAFSDQPSIVSFLETTPLPNVIVLTSLSKSMGAPGVRLGYVYTCDPSLGADVEHSIPIWNLNSLAEYLLEITLKHRPELEASFRQTVVDRSALAEALSLLACVKHVHPSGGNFLVVTLRADSTMAAQTMERLLEQYAIYVKDVSERIGDGRAHLRLAVRLPDENRRLCEALAAIG